MLDTSVKPYGHLDSSYKAAGEFKGIKRLVDHFYDAMEQLPEAKAVLAMHPQDLSLSREKLTHFLCGWLGGPKNYAKRYGPISIPQAHRHLGVNAAERDAWLLCMEDALKQQPYKPEFKAYLLEQLAVPAERIRQAGQVPA